VFGLWKFFLLADVGTFPPLQENIIILSSTCGLGLVTGLIGALILALTPDVTNATDCKQEDLKSTKAVVV
jgi:hypothetical protein